MTQVMGWSGRLFIIAIYPQPKVQGAKACNHL